MNGHALPHGLPCCDTACERRSWQKHCILSRGGVHCRGAMCDAAALGTSPATSQPETMARTLSLPGALLTDMPGFDCLSRLQAAEAPAAVAGGLPAPKWGSAVPVYSASCPEGDCASVFAVSMPI